MYAICTSLCIKETNPNSYYEFAIIKMNKVTIGTVYTNYQTNQSSKKNAADIINQTKTNCLKVYLTHICIQMFNRQVLQNSYLKQPNKEIEQQKGTNRNFFTMFCNSDQCDKLIQMFC